MKLIILICVAFLFSACGPDCVTCVHSDKTNGNLEFCENSESTFTDNNGNSVTFDELIKGVEANGYICN